MRRHDRGCLWPFTTCTCTCPDPQEIPMPDPMADPVPSAAPSRPSSVWLVDLDDLGRDIATFRSTQHETVLRLPRADWEAQGRPGTVRVEVSG